MRAVVQRVLEASVEVGKEIVGQIDGGLMVLLGVQKGDTIDDLNYLVRKIIGLRIFTDENDKMNLSLNLERDSILVVSQFTLLGDARRGFRPSYDEAGSAEEARSFYNLFCQRLREEGAHVEEGRFQTHMKVSLINDGPVTILLDSKKIF